MINEIKEILEDLKNKDISVDDITHNDKVKLIDYITNLQEENERYKKLFEGKEKFSKIMPDDMEFIILSKADYDRQMEDIELIAIKMKQRIDKAVEYIEEKTTDNNGNELGYSDLIDYEELLYILRGDE